MKLSYLDNFINDFEFQNSRNKTSTNSLDLMWTYGIIERVVIKSKCRIKKISINSGTQIIQLTYQAVRQIERRFQWALYHTANREIEEKRKNQKRKMRTYRLHLISRWKMIGKTIDLCEKLENMLRDVLRCSLAFSFFPRKKYLWVVKKKKFPQKINKDGGHLLITMNMRWKASHHITQFIFQLLTQINCFSYHFPS